jgi:hypothetical protein
MRWDCDDGTARVLAGSMGAVRVLLALLSLTACGSGQTCPASCPAASVGATIAVTTMPAAVVNGVEAMLAGPVNGTMMCQPNPPVSSVVCGWPSGMTVVPGTYSLQVSAPGYEATTVQVEVTTPPPGKCGCSSDTIEPSVVSISVCRLPSCRPGPADGSVD